MTDACGCGPDKTRNAVALALGAWTFVPGTVRRLVKGKIGVGTPAPVVQPTSSPVPERAEAR